MTNVLRKPIEITWAVLVAATVISWWVGTEHSPQEAKLSAAILLVVAFIKVYLIGSQFMELQSSHPKLRKGFRAYVAISTLGLIGLALLL